MTIKPLSPSLRESLELATATFEKSLTGGPGEAYLATRGIDRDTAADFRLGYVGTEVPGYEWLVGRLAIPNICAAGHVVGLKFRDLTGDSDQKYIQRTGSQPRMFNTRALLQDSDVIAITEGEIDCITLCQLGIPALSIPSGAGSWTKNRGIYSRLFEGYSKVVVFQDNDEPGRDMGQAILQSDLPVVVLDPPGRTKDLNEAHMHGYDDEIRNLVYGDAK